MSLQRVDPGADGSPMSARDYWTQIANEWPDGRDRLWRTYSDTLNIALCRRWLPDGGTRRLLKTDLFDEAAAEGLWPALVGLAHHVDAMDLSPAVAVRARARHSGLSATATDVRHLPFLDCSFDAIVSNSTLDHFGRREAIMDAVRELYRVLADGGKLILTLDNAANPAVALRNTLPQEWLVRIGLVPYQMGKTLGPRAARSLLEQLGFRVIHATAIVHCPRALAVHVLRLLDGAALSTAWQERCLRALERFEVAERWPTRFQTGHFVAVLAERPAASGHFRSRCFVANSAKRDVPRKTEPAPLSPATGGARRPRATMAL